jgi:hypothetical protein
MVWSKQRARERQELEYIMAGRALTQDALVFARPDGAPFLPNSVTHAFNAIVRRTGLYGLGSMTSGILMPA